MQKIFEKKLEVIVFCSGAIVMVLEMIGSRIVAPYLGTSIFVWTSLIGVILAALSAGYYVGGRLSNNRPALGTLTTIIFISGIAVYTLALFKTPFLALLPGLGIQLGSVIASLVLFAPASFLLGMVSPYALRLRVHELSGVGGVAGNLYALSTIGSIVGTFMAGFVLIPLFGSTNILYGLSIALILLSLLDGKILAKLVILVLVSISFVVIQYELSPYVFERDSTYNHIRVIDYTNTGTGHRSRVLVLATEAHSIIDLDEPTSVISYVRMYRLDSLFAPTINSALTLGGGAYVAPLDYLRRFPTSTMTVVELDPAVTDTAQKYFGLTNNPRLSIVHEDARIYINKNLKKFDAIYGDAFSSYFSIPFQLTTVEAMTRIYDSLTDNGVFAQNIIGSLEGPKSAFFQAEYKTLSSIFPNVYVFPVEYSGSESLERVQNIVIIASKKKQLFTIDALRKNATEEQLEMLERMWTEPIKIAKTVPLLTDEYAPVDNYVARYLQH